MSSSYILAKIDTGGYITCEDRTSWDSRSGRKIVHKQTIDLDKNDHIRCFARLDMAKEALRDEESESFILGLNDEGAAESIYCAPELEPTVKNRLKIWSGCYGSWPVRKLNT